MCIVRAKICLRFEVVQSEITCAGFVSEELEIRVSFSPRSCGVGGEAFGESFGGQAGTCMYICM